jgi:hypothetical protein
MKYQLHMKLSVRKPECLQLKRMILYCIKLILKAALITANIGKTFTVRGYNTEYGIEATKVFEIIDL